jgi:biotin synthase-like enzyme
MSDVDEQNMDRLQDANAYYYTESIRSAARKLKNLWEHTTTEDKSSFLTFLQSQGVRISDGGIKLS